MSAGLWEQGLPVSAGTLGDSVPRFVPLFEPIRAHRNEACLRHADETNWRVQALRESGRSARAWLWISVSDDAAYFHIDPSRSRHRRPESAPTLWIRAALYRTEIHSKNSLERVNKKLHRHPNVVRNFPNEAAIARLAGAILIVQNVKRAIARRQMTGAK